MENFILEEELEEPHFILILTHFVDLLRPKAYTVTVLLFYVFVI